MTGALAGRVAVVTGAASGIGRAISTLFVSEGASVAAVDLNREGLDELERSHGVEPIAVDITDPALAGSVIDQAVERLGGLDIVCNVAGIMDAFQPVGEVSDALWERVMAVNLTAPMMLTRAAIPHLLSQQRGVIINVASIAGLRGGRAGVAYTVSKHGVIGLTRSTASMYREEGIRCVAICPGGVATNIGSGGEVNERGSRLMDQLKATGPRRAEATEIAELALFLASSPAAINGGVFVADGGWTVL